MKKMIVILILISTTGYGQVKFYKSPTVVEFGDSILYQLEDTLVFDYFTQNFRSEFNTFAYNFIIPFDSTIKYDKKSFLQKAVICKKTKCGYFTVSYLNHLLFKYEIRENQVSGIGIVYYLYENAPAVMATFSNNRLNGISIIYSKNGGIESMQIFKKGKYKRYIYFGNSQTEKALEKANKNLFTNPYLESRYKEVQIR